MPIFSPPIKGTYIKKKQEIPMPDLGKGVDSIIKLVSELNALKGEILAQLADMTVKADNALQESTRASTEANRAVKEAKETVSRANQTIKNVEEEANQTISDTKDEAIQVIKETKQGEPGNPGKDAPPISKEEIIKEIMQKIPDKKVLIKSVLQALPEDKPSLKIIQEKFETDPMSVIDKILELAKKGKFKLKTEHIDGLDQTISAFSNQLGRGYLHGGGDSLKAGSGITLTANADGTKTIVSTGGGTFTGDIDITLYDTGDQIHYTLPSIPIANTFNLYRGGAKQTTIASDYTLVGTALTLTIALESSNSLIGNWQT